MQRSIACFPERIEVIDNGLRNLSDLLLAACCSFIVILERMAAAVDDVVPRDAGTVVPVTVVPAVARRDRDK